MNSRFPLFLALSFTAFVIVEPAVFAQELPDVARPQTGGEWAQVYTPVGEVLGGAGIQGFSDPVELKAGQGLVQIEAPILEALNAGNPQQFSSITLRALEGDAPDAGDLSAFEGKALTLENYHELAKVVSDACADERQVCQIRFSRENEALLIETRPMKMGEISVEGNRYFRASAIQRQLKMPEGETLDPKKLERKVRLLQDNPDISAEIELEPVEMSETVNVKVKVEDKLPIHVSGFWTNLDQTFYGRNLSGVSTVINNITGNNDTFMATSVIDPRSPGVFLHYEIPLNSHGTRWGIDYSYMRANPVGKDFNWYGVRGRFWGITSTLSQQLIARENLRVSTDLNVDWRQIRTKSKFGTLEDDTGPVSWRNITYEREKLRDIRWGIQMDQAGENHEFAMRHEFTVGIPIFGGTPASNKNVGNPGSGSQFFKYLGAASYSHTLPWDTEIALSGTGQWSRDTLPSTDVGGLGGTYFGRGYPEGFIQADTLLFTSAEFRFPCFVIPPSWKFPGTEDKIRDKVRLLGFMDYGFGIVNDRNLVDDPTEHILSTGFGVRVELSKYLSGRFDLGFPLLKQPTPINKPGARIHFGLQANLL